MLKEKNKLDDQNEKILESLRVWPKNLFIFDAIFDWEVQKNNEPIIKLNFDIPSGTTMTIKFLWLISKM